MNDDELKAASEILGRIADHGRYSAKELASLADAYLRLMQGVSFRVGIRNQLASKGQES